MIEEFRLPSSSAAVEVVLVVGYSVLCIFLLFWVWVLCDFWFWLGDVLLVSLCWCLRATYWWTVVFLVKGLCLYVLVGIGVGFCIGADFVHDVVS